MLRGVVRNPAAISGYNRSATDTAGAYWRKLLE